MKKLWYVMLAGVILPVFLTGCQNNQSEKNAAEKAVTTENPAEKQAAKEEEAQEKAMFTEKVAMYSQWDEDQNGTLDQDEFLKGAGALFAEIDQNGNGKIEKEEWETYKQNAKDELASEKALFLDKTEMYSQLGDQGMDQSAFNQKVKEVWNKLDANGNGKVELSEYKNFLK